MRWIVWIPRMCLVETLCTRRWSWWARNVRCCVNTIKRRRNILRTLNSAGLLLRKSAFSSNLWMSSSFFMGGKRLNSIRLRRLGTLSSATLPSPNVKPVAESLAFFLSVDFPLRCVIWNPFTLFIIVIIINRNICCSIMIHWDRLCTGLAPRYPSRRYRGAYVLIVTAFPRDVQHLWQLRMQVTPHWTDYNQWRCHNCSSGTRALMRYRVIIETVPTEGSRKYFLTVGWIRTTICGTDIYFQTIVSAPYVLVPAWFPCFDYLISGAIWR